MERAKARLPIFPLGTVLFPGMLLPLHLFEERYRKLTREHETDDPIFGVVLTKRGREVSDQPDTHEIGTAASLVGIQRYPDGRCDIVVRGGRRFQILDFNWDRGYMVALVAWLEEEPGDLEAGPALADRVWLAYQGLVSDLSPGPTDDTPPKEPPGDPGTVAHSVAAGLPLNTWERQQLLAAPTTAERLHHVLRLLHRERSLLRAAGVGGAVPDHPGRGFSSN